MNMLMNRMLPLILLLMISRSVAAEDIFWVLGSFLEEDVARVDGSRISNNAGIEVLLFESMVNGRVQYRLLTDVLRVAPSNRAALRQQLIKFGVSDLWTLRFDDAPPYMEVVFSDGTAANALSAAELAEIDSMLNYYDDGYVEGALMDMAMLAEDNSSGLVSTTSVGLALNYVVVGSYGSIENANDQVSKLGDAVTKILSQEVTVRRKQISGEIVYRVLIGPVLPIEVNDLMGSLTEWGVLGAWLLPEVMAPAYISSQGSNQDVSQPQRGFGVPSQHSSQASVAQVKVFSVQDDFNPVLLRKSSPKFPDPRNKH